MKETLATYWELLQQIRLLDVVDILVLAIALYQLIKLTWESRASQVLKGFAILIVINILSKMLQLTVISELLGYLLNSGVVVLVVLFQPELRRALERLGAGKLWESTALHGSTGYNAGDVVNQIMRALQAMSKSKTGVLLVIQRENTLTHVLETGIAVDGLISEQLLGNIFFKNSPLHDGAAVIHDNKVVAAGCFLPLTHNNDLSTELGTRHRAALGMSEQTDALVIIVSEETGVISMAQGGKLTRYLDSNALRAVLNDVYHPRAGGKGLAALMRRRNSDETHPS